MIWNLIEIEQFFSEITFFSADDETSFFFYYLWEIVCIWCWIFSRWFLTLLYYIFKDFTFQADTSFWCEQISSLFEILYSTSTSLARLEYQLCARVKFLTPPNLCGVWGLELKSIWIVCHPTTCNLTGSCFYFFCFFFLKENRLFVFVLKFFLKSVFHFVIF